MKPTLMRGHRFAFIFSTLLIAGCQSAMTSSRSDLAEQVHQDLKTINASAQEYKKDYGRLPGGNFWEARAALVLEGYITHYPTPPSAIFSEEPMDYRLDPGYGKMDAGDTPDATIAIWGLKDAICRDYNRRYATEGIGEEIFDWQAQGKKYPGEAIGRHITTYAIKWESDAVNDCEINWVVEYR